MSLGSDEAAARRTACGRCATPPLNPRRPLTAPPLASGLCIRRVQIRAERQAAAGQRGEGQGQQGGGKPTPGLGQHTKEVLAELGYNDEAVEGMEAAGVLGPASE